MPCKPSECSKFKGQHSHPKLGKPHVVTDKFQDAFSKRPSKRTPVHWFITHLFAHSFVQSGAPPACQEGNRELGPALMTFTFQ